MQLTTSNSEKSTIGRITSVTALTASPRDAA